MGQIHECVGLRGGEAPFFRPGPGPYVDTCAHAKIWDDLPTWAPSRDCRRARFRVGRRSAAAGGGRTTAAQPPPPAGGGRRRPPPYAEAAAASGRGGRRLGPRRPPPQAEAAAASGRGGRRRGRRPSEAATRSEIRRRGWCANPEIITPTVHSCLYMF